MLKRNFVKLLLAAAILVMAQGVWPPSQYNSALILATNYLPAGYSFGTLTGGNPTTLANLNASLSYWQAIYGSGIVTSTSQYVDGTVVLYAVAQATALSATQGYKCVLLPPSSEYWDQRISYDGTKVRVGDCSETDSPADITIYTQTVNLLKGSATGTASNSSNLTISGSVTGQFLPGQILAGTGIPYGTAVVSQTSGTTGGDGVYVISAVVTVSGTTVTAAMPALHIFGGVNIQNRTVVSGLNFEAFNGGRVSMPGTGGTAAAGGVPSGMTVPSGFYYATGSVALAIENASSGVMRNLSFTNYDTPHAWLTWNVYIWNCDNCFYNSNNEGPNVDGQIPNSFENMRWTQGGTGNNNYNVHLAPGAGAGGSYFLDHMSNDFGNVYNIYWDGGANAGNDLNTSLVVTNNHIENSSTVGGTGCRIYNAGQLQLIGNFGYEDGPTFPTGWVCPAFYARTSVVGNVIPGTGFDGIYVPAVLGTTQQWRPTGSGNLERFGNDVVLWSGTDGILMGGPPQFPYQAQAASYSLSLASQLPIQLLNTGGTITVPPDATINQILGTVISFVTTDTSTWAISCAGPPTCTGTLTGIGGAVGTSFTLTKTGANAWTRH